MVLLAHCNELLACVIYPMMAHTGYYIPAIPRPLIAALYHEAKQRRIPMTRLLAEILRSSLKDSQGWRRAAQDWPELAAENEDSREAGG